MASFVGNGIGTGDRLDYEYERIEMEARTRLGVVPDEEILAADPRTLALKLLNGLELAVPTLNESAQEWQQGPGDHPTVLRLRIPFKGNGALFFKRGLTLRASQPKGTVDGSVLVLTYRNQGNPDAIQAEVGRDIGLVKAAMEDVQNEANRQHGLLGEKLAKAIAARQRHLIETRARLDASRQKAELGAFQVEPDKPGEVPGEGRA